MTTFEEMLLSVLVLIIGIFVLYFNRQLTKKVLDQQKSMYGKIFRIEETPKTERAYTFTRLVVTGVGVGFVFFSIISLLGVFYVIR